MKSWDRQPTDTEESWALFKAYRDSRPPRRLYYTCVPGDTRRPANELLILSQEHMWLERAADYDLHLDHIIQGERERIMRVDVAERTAEHLYLLRDLRDLAADQARKKLAEAQSSEMSSLTVNDITKLTDAAVKLDRLMHGESTENVATSVDPSKLSTEEIKTLLHLQRKATGEDVE